MFNALLVQKGISLYNGPFLSDAWGNCIEIETLHRLEIAVIVSVLN